MAISERWRRVDRSTGPAPTDPGERKKHTQRMQRLPDEKLTADELKERRKDWASYYMIDFRDLNTPKKDRIFEVGGTTRTQAKDLLTRRLGEVRAKTYINPRSLVVTTFAAAVTEFLKEHKTKTDYTEHATKAAKAYFGEKALGDLRPGDFDSFRRSLQDRNLGASTVRKYMTAAGTLLEWARRKGFVTVNPSADVEKPAEPTHKVRFLTYEEWVKLDAAAPPWLRPLLTFAVASGARLKEIVGLRWDEVDLAGGMIHFGEDNKTGKPRTIPLNDTLRQIVKDQIRHVRSPYVFVDSEGFSYTGDVARNRISKRTTALAESLGLEGAGFHTLRHTAASWMVQTGEPIAKIQAVLVHAGIQTTIKYAHLKPEHLSDSMAALDAAVRGNGGKVATPAVTSPEPEPDAAPRAPNTQPERTISGSGRGAAW